MKNDVTVSVVIPVYNVEKYLKECVDSVLKQTYPLFEIILVDDGSTDLSGNICDEYAASDNRIKVIHKINGGLSSARNSGLGKSTGKYVYFLDSDDYIVPQTLEMLVETAERDDSDIVFFDAFSFADADGDFKVSQNYIRKNNYKSGKGTFVFSRLQKNDEFHSAVPLLFIKKDVLGCNDISFKDGVYYEDMLFTYQALCCADVVSQCREALYHRRYRQDSIMTSRKNEKHFTSFVQIYKEVKLFSERRGIADEAFAKTYIARCAFNCFNIYEKLSKSEKINQKNNLRGIADDILQNNAYGNKALKMRCYGKAFWMLYKVIEIPFKKRS